MVLVSWSLAVEHGLSSAATLAFSLGLTTSLTVLRLLNLIALLIAVAWLARNPDWEPAVTVMSLLVGLLAQEYPRLKSNAERDRALFLKLKDQFPSNGKTAKFLQQHDFGASYSPDSTDDLDRFLSEWSNAEHEFINRNIEQARKVLLLIGHEFRQKLSIAVEMNRRGWYEIGMHEPETRPEMFQLQSQLNDLASRVYKAHQNIMRAGSRVE